mgnify:CR=1 FL=1
MSPFSAPLFNQIVTGPRKIASIGVGVRRWVTYHGFALNVDTDLSFFRRINLCGLKGREDESIENSRHVFGKMRYPFSWKNKGSWKLLPPRKPPFY